jgi:hypothetical protein
MDMSSISNLQGVNNNANGLEEQMQKYEAEIRNHISVKNLS